MGDFLSRLIAAAPSAGMAAVFLLAWIDPAYLGPAYVKNLMLVMLFEFIVMHSTIMCGVIIAQSDSSRGLRVLLLLGMTAFYALFVLAFAYAFQSWWPLWVFAYLFVCRFMYVLASSGDVERRFAAAAAVWGVSALAYLGGAFFTVLVPLPRLGITPEVVAAMDLSRNMSGAWIDKPWIVLAFGAIYFAVQAAAQYRFALTSSIVPGRRRAN